jgi:aspartate/methionine/tyrosine aminotransferase
VFSPAPYMEWAKSRPRPAIDLAGSNLLACSLEDLPGAREAMDIAGESPEGYPPLLDAIARHCGVEPERVATAVGCSGATFLACAALLSPGDDVLVESPNYDPLPGAARLLGARVATFARRFEDSYALDPAAVAAALTPRTRLVILSNPHNPSGALASPESLADLGRLAETRGFHVLVDEVYRDVVLEDRPRTVALLSERFVAASSLTKAYGLASLRCGWAIASPEVALAIRRTRDVVDVWSPMPADRISVVAFRNLPALAARTRRIVEENSRAVIDFLSRRRDLECAPTRATIAFPRLASGADAGPFVRRLFAETATAVAPGRFFGAPEHFRIAFGGDPTRVRAGLEALGRCLDSA